MICKSKESIGIKSIRNGIYEKKKKNKAETAETDDIQLEETEEDNDTSEDWKIEVLNQIKLFSPKKFESFSRLLFSHMGIKFDREKGVKMSGDHGIDGYG